MNGSEDRSRIAAHQNETYVSSVRCVKIPQFGDQENVFGPFRHHSRMCSTAVLRHFQAAALTAECSDSVDTRFDHQLAQRGATPRETADHEMLPQWNGWQQS